MNPQPLDSPAILQSDGSLALDDVDAYKKYSCVKYDRCLSIAARAGWPQWQCTGCTSYEELPADHYARRLFARAGAALLQGARTQTCGVAPVAPVEATARERYERMRTARRKSAATRSARLAAERERMREILLAQAETELARERINAILDGRLRPGAIERAQLQVLRERVRAERARGEESISQ